MKCFKLIFSFLFISINAKAYIPTFDSLLRNGNNPDIANNTVVANLKIKYIPAPNSEEAKSPIILNNAVKYVLYNEREDFPKLVQLQYAGGKITSSNLHDVKVFPFHNLKSLRRGNENIEQQFFYSLLGMFLRNDSSLLVEFLKKQGVRVQSNKELMNKEKLRLLRDYRYYLKKVKESSTVSNDLQNPLYPSDPEEREKVGALMKTPLLSPDSYVKRFKNGDYFNWVVETDQVFASFDYEHRLEELTLKTSEGELKATCGRFLIQGSKLEFPEVVTLTDFRGNKYEIRAVSLKMFPDNSKRYFRRLKRYKKQISENKLNEVSEKLKIVL